MYETKIFEAHICGYHCEVVSAGRNILLYVDGFFHGELWPEGSLEDYISQIEEILDV